MITLETIENATGGQCLVGGCMQYWMNGRRVTFYQGKSSKGRMYYWYARWQENGKQRSRYIGKEDPRGKYPPAEKPIPKRPQIAVYASSKRIAQNLAEYWQVSERKAAHRVLSEAWRRIQEGGENGMSK
jgi:hypothetical protein